LYGVTVEDPESFQLALRNSLVANKTTLIDARIDQQPYWDGFALSIGAI
jgi:thiamine pyrophosphate-dependent acetolactate synthase large subunit-like protein